MSTIDELSHFLTPKEAAHALRLTERGVHRRIAAGEPWGRVSDGPDPQHS